MADRRAWLLAFLGLAAGWLWAGGALPPCPIRWLSGIPCPGCGMGRACALLAQGNPAGAWALHPGAFGLAAYVGWALLPLSARRRLALPRRASTAAGILLLALLLCRWALVLQGHIEV